MQDDTVAAAAPAPERSRRGLLIQAAAVVVVVLLVGGFLVYWFLFRTSTMTVRGTVGIRGARDSGRYVVSTPDKAGNSSCTGAGGFTDVSGGAPLVISDAAGNRVATGTLNPGLYVAGLHACIFGFLMKVPDDLDTYGVTVGVHGTALVSRADLRRGPALTLGAP